jgi:hypothetical protein
MNDAAGDVPPTVTIVFAAIVFQSATTFWLRDTAAGSSSKPMASALTVQRAFMTTLRGRNWSPPRPEVWPPLAPAAIPGASKKCQKNIIAQLVSSQLVSVEPMPAK